jgi:hypothetical protein
VGGLGAIREPGSTVIARAGFEQELERSRNYRPPFRYFFGTGTMTLDVKPDRLIAAPETISDGGLDLVLIPAKSGETNDALFVQDKKHDLLFVGDAFMPYVGAPFVPEGSPEGHLGAIATMPGLRDAMGALYEHGLAAARTARPLADVLHDNFIPDSLRRAPAAVQPYLIVRDQFLQRLYLEHAGYWQSNGEGIDVFTRAEWAAALDVLGGGSEAAFVRAATQLESRGDASLALQLAEFGLVRYSSSTQLQQVRARALTTLRDINSQMNPFRFIVYSEWAGRGMGQVAPAESAR